MTTKLYEKFQKILTKKQISTDQTRISKFTTDWTGVYRGNADIILYPNNPLEISEIFKMCVKDRINLITVGGNTNLAASCVPEKNEVFLSTERMNNFEFDSNEGILRSEAGVILQKAQEEINTHGFETPYNLGSRGSCTIGGNVATNAGGINFVKYGSLRNYILGLEVVLPSGDIIDMMKKIQKDNTGLDLKQLFIGTEGIFGIITKVNMLCKHIPSSRSTFMLKLKGFQNVLEIMRESKRIFGSHLNAIEYVDWESYHLYSRYKKDYKMPLGYDDYNINCTKIYDNESRIIKSELKDHFLLVELTGETDDQLMQLIESFFMINEKKIADSSLAQNDVQRKELWDIREEQVLSLVHQYKVLKYDLSFEAKYFEKIAQKTREKFHGEIEMVSTYGHIGDGNVHLQVMMPKDIELDLNLKHKIDDFIYKFAIKHNGSISAEHGVGIIKRDYLEEQKGQIYINQMKALKKHFDPYNILNPNKTIYM